MAMRRVLIDLVRDDIDGQARLPGVVELAPTQRRNAPDGDAVILPAGFAVEIGDEPVEVLLESTGPHWCWRAVERLPGGAERHFVVPDGDTGALLHYGDLDDVDPDTLDPSAEPEAAWWLALQAGGGGGGGSGLIPDPDNPGYFIVTLGSSLTPDPDNPGYFLIGD